MYSNLDMVLSFAVFCGFACTALKCCSTVFMTALILQAKRLVKSSIIAVETTEQEVDDDDFFQDNAEVADFVNAHRGAEILPAAGGDQQGRHHVYTTQELHAQCPC